MNELPTWMGLAPLLGFLLDALLGGFRRSHLLARYVLRTGRRLELICRTATGDNSRAGGIFWVVWVLGTSLVAAWLVETAAWAAFEEEGRFAARVLLVFAALRLRFEIGELGSVQADIEAQSPRRAKAHLAALGADPEGFSDPEIAGATVQRLARTLLDNALVPLTMAVPFGAMGAVVAVAARTIGDVGPRTGDDDPFHRPARRLSDAIGTAAGLVGTMILPIALPAVGGRKRGAQAAWMHTKGRPPTARLAAVIAHGLGLDQDAGGAEGGEPARPTDVQRAVIVVWISAVSAAALGAVVLCVAYRVL